MINNLSNVKPLSIISGRERQANVDESDSIQNQQVLRLNGSKEEQAENCIGNKHLLFGLISITASET
jgi:hypothetical protein